MAQRILKEKTNLAGGGIIAFANPNEANNQGVVDDKERGIAFPKGSETDKRIVENVKKTGSDFAEFLRTAPSAIVGKFNELNQPRATSFAGTQAELDDLVQRGRMPKRAAAPEVSPLNEEAKQSEAAYLAAVADKPNAVVKGAVPVAPAPAAPAPVAPATGIKTAAPTAAAPATTGAGTGIKAAPSDKIMPTAGIKLPNTEVPGLQRPVAPIDPDANKTTAQIAADKEAYMGPNAGAREAMAKLMSERANSVDEARRISALRMAEFFGAWGSTPGNTIVAGLNTLKNKVPDLIGDMKEATKIRRQIDKDISELEKIERLEKSGNYDEAAKRKAKLGDNALQKYGYDVKAYSDAQQTAAYLKAAEIRGASGSGAGGEGKAGTLYNQAVIRYQTEEKNIIAAKEKDKEYKRALIKLRTDPTNAEALAIKNTKEAGWNNKLKERQDDVDYYKNKQGREARVSGESGESNAGKVKTYNPATGKLE
jgi:hypothetical protein